MNYVLTDDAEADLRAIIRYTRRQWGVAQTRVYVTKLKAGIASVAVGQGTFKKMDALHPNLCMAHIEHHYVFCLTNQDRSALVVAILHERMDLIVRVAERLQ